MEWKPSILIEDPDGVMDRSLGRDSSDLEVSGHIPVVPMGLIPDPAARRSDMDGILISDPEPPAWSCPVPLDALLARDDCLRPRDR